MTIAEGDKLPAGTFQRNGAEGIEDVTVEELTAGKKVVLFAVPGAFTPTCHSAHVPSFIRTKAGFDAKGIDAILCLAVNDPHVMRVWGEATGATEAGIGMLSDPTGEFAKAIGMATEAPGKWINGRSKRYAMYVEDGVVKVFHPQVGAGCEISGGEAMLASV